jgi:hypothetical protein
MEPREIIRSKDINANPIKKSENAGPRPWELQKYIYQEKPTEEKESSHVDPRLELARRQNQESHFIPSDEGDGYGPSVLGNGFMPGLDAHASSPSDPGTLAGGDALTWNKWGDMKIGMSMWVVKRLAKYPGAKQDIRHMEQKIQELREATQVIRNKVRQHR